MSAIRFLSVAISLTLAMRASADLPQHRAEKLEIEFVDGMGKLSAGNFVFKFADGIEINERDFSVDLASKDDRVHLVWKDKPYDIHDYFSFLQTCRSTQLKEGGYSIDRSQLVFEASKAIRECPGKTHKFSSFKFTCDGSSSYLSSPAESIISQCLANTSDLQIASYVNISSLKLPFYLRPFVPKEIKDISFHISKHSIKGSLTAVLAKKSEQAEMSGDVEYLEDSNTMRIRLSHLRVGLIPNRIVMKILPKLFDPNTIEFKRERSRFVVDVHLDDL